MFDNIWGPFMCYLERTGRAHVMGAPVETEGASAVSKAIGLLIFNMNILFYMYFLFVPWYYFILELWVGVSTCGITLRMWHWRL